MDYNKRIDALNRIVDKVDDISGSYKSYDEMSREELTYIAKAMTIVSLQTVNLIKRGVW